MAISMKTIEKKIEARMRDVAKQRDKLDEHISLLSDLRDDCDNCLSHLQDARDALSELV